MKEPKTVTCPRCMNPWNLGIFYSDPVCLHDARLPDEFHERLKAVKSDLINSLPKGVGFWIRWVNILNADVESDDFNPLGSVGRFVAFEEPRLNGNISDNSMDELMADLSKWIEKTTPIKISA